MKQLTQKEYEQRALMSMKLAEVSGELLVFEGAYYKGRQVVANRLRDYDYVYKVKQAWKLESFFITDCYWR